ncbi:hypothetical protein [Varibaculum timonense]|uniref:hypothetical protein n=1 Tax=Varibaculum timonense TaxID=1964383 RepID=UPI0022E09ABF|nr:hypothetical protein [Varibaculum timonense]
MAVASDIITILVCSVSATGSVSAMVKAVSSNDITRKYRNPIRSPAIHTFRLAR